MILHVSSRMMWRAEISWYFTFCDFNSCYFDIWCFDWNKKWMRFSRWKWIHCNLCSTTAMLPSTARWSFKMQIYANFLIKFERNSLVISRIVKLPPYNFPLMTFNCPQNSSHHRRRLWLTFPLPMWIVWAEAKSKINTRQSELTFDHFIFVLVLYLQLLQGFRVNINAYRWFLMEIIRKVKIL